ncbi:MAG: vWA domain-containing protein [Thermincolia bacterium]
MINEFGRCGVSGGEDDFANLIADSRELGELVEVGQGMIACFPLIIWELFNQLYRGRGGTGDTKVRRVSLVFSRLLVENLLGRVRSGNLLTNCRGDLFGAALGTLYLGRELLIHFPPDLVRMANCIWLLEGQIRRQNLAALASGKVEEMLAGVGQYALRMTYAKKVEYLVGARVRSEERLQEVSDRMMDYFGGAGPVEKIVLARLEGEKKLIGLWAAVAGWSGHGGKWQRGSVDRAMKLAGKLACSPKLERIARRLGRIRGLALMDRTPDQQGMTMGNDLNRVIHEDLVQLNHPRLGREFRRRFQEEALWQDGDEGIREVVENIVCLDNSGSMEGPKEEVAKVLAMALWERARRQREEIVVIMFGGPEDPLQSIRLLPGSPPEDGLAVGELFLRSRSTDYEKPLRAALQLLKKRPGSRGSITFITDGICRIGEGFLKEFMAHKRHLGFQVTGIVVTYGQADTEGLKAFCDRTLISTDLLGHDILGELFSYP